MKLVFIFLASLIVHCSWSQFLDRAPSLGVDERHYHLSDEDSDFEWGTGAAWIDYDLDGDLDLYISNRAADNVFYENQIAQGSESFIDVTGDLGLECSKCDCSGISIADYNNDGYPDIYLATAREDKLYENQDGLDFLDVSHKLSGISGDTRGTTVSWIDFDNDGYLDLYVASHIPALYTHSLPGANPDTLDYLLHNNGGSSFSDASFLIDQFDVRHGSSFAAAWTDYDNDNDFDLFVTNDCTVRWPVRTIIYENKGGIPGDWTTWVFDTVHADLGIQECVSAMGVAEGDINNDGFMEIAYSNIGPMVLWKNDNGFYENISSSSGVDIQDMDHYSWGVNMGDMDLDGWTDVLLVSAAPSIEPLGGGATVPGQPNYYFHNDGAISGGETFSDWSDSHFFNDTSRAMTSIQGDYDNDGDLDMFIVNYDSRAQLMKNIQSSSRHWVKIQLEGVISNRSGIGTKAKVYTPDGTVQYDVARSGGSLGGGNSPYLHFGLNDNETIDSIVLDWPSGVHQAVTSIPSDTFITIVEDQLLSQRDIRLQMNKENDAVVLRWNRISDRDQAYEVQRSEDGVQFETISLVSRSVENNLKYRDAAIIHRDYYYRIKLDNIYSNTLFISRIPQLHSVYPTYGSLNKIFINNPIDYASIVIYDISGRVVFNSNVSEDIYFIVPKINIPGFYYLELKSRQKKEIIKLIKY